MVDIVDLAAVRRASVKDASAARVRATSARPQSLTPLTEIDAEAWRTLATRAAEPNGYDLPEWELAVNASVPGRTGASALAAWHEQGWSACCPWSRCGRLTKFPCPLWSARIPTARCARRRSITAWPTMRRHPDAGRAAIRRPRAGAARGRARRRGNESDSTWCCAAKACAPRVAIRTCGPRWTPRATPTNCWMMRWEPRS